MAIGVRGGEGRTLIGCAVLSSQWFAPTELVISFETEGQGRFTPEEIASLVERDKGGRVVALRLPRKTVLIANHQVRLARLPGVMGVVNGEFRALLQIYADWWYAWTLTYLMGTHRDVFIVLKKSLKWLPILGWVSRVRRDMNPRTD